MFFKLLSIELEWSHGHAFLNSYVLAYITCTHSRKNERGRGRDNKKIPSRHTCTWNEVNYSALGCCTIRSCDVLSKVCPIMLKDVPANWDLI